MAPPAGVPHRGAMPAPDRRASSAIAPIDLATLVLLGALWGAAYLFSRIAAPEVGALWVGVARVGIAAAVLLALTGSGTIRAIRSRPRQFLIVGLTSSAIPFTLIAVAALTLPTALGGLLNATTPLFTALFSVGILGQRLTTRTMVGMGFGLAAVVVLLGWSPLEIGPATVVAALAALGAAANFGIAGVVARRWMADVPPMHLAAGQMTVATLVLLPLALASGVPAVPTPGAVVALVAIGVGSTALAWPLYFRTLRRSTATAASTVTFIIPGFAIAWGALVLGEAPGPGTAAGIALVIVSLVLVLDVRLPRPSRAIRPANQPAAGPALPTAGRAALPAEA